MKKFLKKSVVILIIMSLLMIDFLPLSNVWASAYKDRDAYSGEWKNIWSSSGKIIEIMASQLKYANFVKDTKYNYYNSNSIGGVNEIKVTYDIHKGLYYIRIPENYFDIYKNNNYYNDYNAEDRVREFDFSNSNLGDISLLPDFSQWCTANFNSDLDHITFKLKFNNCGITDLSAFKTAVNNGYLDSVDIELGGNRVTKKDYDEFKELTKSHDIHIDKEPETYSETTEVPAVSTKEDDNKNSTDSDGNANSNNTNIRPTSIPDDIAYILQNVGIDGSTFKKALKQAKNDNGNWVLNLLNSANFDGNMTQEEGNRLVNYIYEQAGIMYTITWNLNVEEEPGWEVICYQKSWVNISDENTYSKTKTMTLNAEMTGETEPGVAPWAGDCIMTVTKDGKETTVKNNAGVGKYTITENGTYKVEIRYYTFGKGDTYTFKINTIDNKKPSYKLTKSYYTGLEEKTYGVKLNITAQDDCELKTVYVDGKEFTVSGKKATVITNIVKTGKYTIKVVDQAGNEYSKEEYIEVDTEAPEIVESTVVKNNDIGYKGNVGDSPYCIAKVGDSPYCIAKVGDTIKVTLKANEEIKSYGAKIGTSDNSGDMAVSLDGRLYKTGKIAVGSDTITFDIQLTEEWMEELKDEDAENCTKWVEIGVYGITDNTNNSMDYTIKNLLYIDNTAPSINKIEISGGRKSSNNNFMFLDSGENLTIDVYMDEKLSKDPTIKIGNYEFKATYYDEVTQNNKKYYLYKVAQMSCDSIIKNGSINENGTVPIIIKDCVDMAGNTAEEYTIDESNNSLSNVLLAYGTLENEEMYIVSEGNEDTSRSKGDINGDGYVTSYDLLLMDRHLNLTNKLDNTKLTYADFDGNNKISVADRMSLEKVLKSSKNNIYQNIARTFKVYDKNNEQIDGSNLDWKIYDCNGSEITTEECITKTIDEENGTLELTMTDSTVCPIIIKAYLKDESANEDEKTVGKIKLEYGDSSNATIEVLDSNKTGYDILGDVNNDGYVTSYDGLLIMRHVSKFLTLTDDEIKRADIVKDGRLSSIDSLTIFREDKNVDNESYNVIKKGESITLNLVTNNLERYTGENSFKNDNIEDQLQWQVISENANVLELKQNEDGSCTIEAIGSDGDRAIVKGTAKILNENNEEETVTALFYVEIAENVNIELSKNEVEYDLSKENTEDIIITASSNINNKNIECTSSDENIVKVECDDFGNAKIIPISSGTANINFTCEGVTKSCKVNVIKSIQEINVDKKQITLKESMEEEIVLNLDSAVTEDVCLNSKDESVARIYYNEERETYKVKAISAGETEVEIYSASDPNVKQTIKVKVNELKTPKISKIQIEQHEKGKIYKTGDEIYIKIKFDDVIIGEAPDLLLQFGDYKSVNEAEFIEFADDKTALRYKYEIGENDNGILMIEKLVGKGLSDDTFKLGVNQIVDNDYYNREYEEEESVTVNSDSVTSRASYGLERTVVTDEDSETEEYINDGIYQLVLDIETDTEKPEIKIEPINAKGNNWLKIGDEIRVQLIASEELQSAPKVYFNGIEATVEGSKEIYTATMKVTDVLEAGCIEIKVNDYKDLAGNMGDELIATEENMEEPIIIDNSAPIIKSVVIKKVAGKEYKAGESFDIVVNFEDSAQIAREYIIADSAPILNLKYGDNAAQGSITNDYEPGKYVESITYTYTVSENDKGDLTIEGLTGIISDVAGNTTDLSQIKILSSAIIEENQSGNEQEDKNNDVVDSIYNGLIPQTGEEIIRNICIVLVIGIAVTLAIYCYKKNKKQNN